MKYILYFLLSTFMTCTSAEESKNIEAKMNDTAQAVKKQNLNQDNLNALIDKSTRMATWEIKENDKGYMMTLDYPYPNLEPVDNLSLTILKNKSNKRPYLLSCAVSSIIDSKKGFNIYFGSYENNKLKIGTKKSENIPISEKHDDYLKITFENMYIKNQNAKLDIFNEMINNDVMFFVFYNKSGEKYSISYPLFKFKEQYKGLK